MSIAREQPCARGLFMFQRWYRGHFKSNSSSERNRPQESKLQLTRLLRPPIGQDKVAFFSEVSPLLMYDCMIPIGQKDGTNEQTTNNQTNSSQSVSLSFRNNARQSGDGMISTCLYRRTRCVGGAIARLARSTWWCTQGTPTAGSIGGRRPATSPL